ncbi:39S ribosomal protein L55 [Mactra antiquata]
MASIVKFSRYNTLSLLRFATGQTTCISSQRHNSNRASITRIKEDKYLRTYKCLLVKADGSSIRIRYEKPKLLLRLPVNKAELHPEELAARMRRFAPPKKIEIKEDIVDDFDSSSYAKLLKKKRRQN